ncbi:septum formation initiator family protein [Microbacterium sp. APC 3898]|uniref:Septum formation initiator family protein n=2 Tax=Planococcus TaxID=1372 RepID=A0ABT7ZPQ0_9BACL|nr:MULTISPECIES: septum formation initiator family protein [Terrabacteria group]MBD8016774.1 septum formation initiator family protein [Planococcus wigleyi]MDN3429130.1 septum formation initiator family protein [Planococcus sp. APC 4016]MDN3439887.1 septum formation initiator family protein [Planococcus sp. APC 3900]MDN3500934.1 septum formation initiator family protein [Microbacterium sp. APC 3898]
MSLKRDQKAETREVTSIRNDYVRSVEMEGERKKAHRVRLFRRLTVFGLLVLMATIWVGSTIYAQTQTISEKEELRIQALQQLEEVEKQQSQLEEQILLLNDEEYLAKLARKDYFLSDEGEIIFTTPNTEKKDEEKPSEEE